MSFMTWHQLYVTHVDWTDGKRFSRFVTSLVESLGLRFVFVGVVEGGEVGRLIDSCQGRVVPTEKLVEEIATVVSFDWCDLYFPKSEQYGVADGLDCRAGISGTHLTVRILDGWTLEVYSPDPAALKVAVTLHGEGVEVEYDSGTLEELTIGD